MKIRWGLGILFILLQVSCSSTYFFKGDRNPAGLSSESLYFSKGPFVTYLEPGKVIITVERSGSVHPTLEYWAKGESDEKKSLLFEEGWARLYQVKVEGLIPSQPYEFDVHLGNRRTPAYEFTPGVSADQSFKFLVVGNTASESTDVYSSLIDQMTERQGSLFFHLGNFVRDGSNTKQWDEFFRVSEPMLTAMPIVAIAGRTDLSREGIFEGIFLRQRPEQERYYAFQYGKTLFLILDTNETIVAGDSQYDFIGKQLELAKTTGIQKTFVFGHHSPYSSGRKGSREDLQRDLIPLLNRYAITAFFSADPSGYERLKSDLGIYYIVSGGGGQSIRQIASSNMTLKAFEGPHFCEVTVEDTTATLRVFNSFGLQIDEATL